MNRKQRESSKNSRQRTEQFWKLEWIVRRKLKKLITFKYLFKASDGATQEVCKVFFLTTLGYKK